MAECLIQDTTLTAIADAIRAKTETTDTMLPSEMAALIESIATGSDLGFLSEVCTAEVTASSNDTTKTLLFPCDFESIPTGVIAYHTTRVSVTSSSVTYTLAFLQYKITVSGSDKYIVFASGNALSSGLTYKSGGSVSYTSLNDGVCTISMGNRTYSGTYQVIAWR